MEKAKTVFLVGTDHQYQYPKNKHSDEFRKLVAATCKSHNVKAIAEEMSLDALSLHGGGATQSVGKQVADSFRIRHCYCDPSRKEQIKLGIAHPGKKDPSEDAIRERCWLKHLLEMDTWPVLFVCGRDHTKSFPALLRGNCIVMRLLFTDWKPPVNGEIG